MRTSQSERGQSTIFMALAIGTVLLGFLAFALDVGYLFHQKRMAQSAADAAAVAAAEEDAYPGGNAQAAAAAAAKLNGFDTTLATNPATVTLTLSNSGMYSNTGSPYQTNAWVQVVVSRPISTFFLAALRQNMSTMTVAATASAGEGQGSSTCVCLEGSTGQDLNMSNDSQLSANSCGITVNSSSGNALGVVGGSTLSAQTLGTVSTTWNNAGNINNDGTISATTNIVQGITTSCSPSMPTAPTDTVCSADPYLSQQGGATYTVGPNSPYGTTQGGDTICYTALTVAANNDSVTLNPGIYVINGGALTFASGTMHGGDGVTFYLKGVASVSIANGADVNLTAPTSGTYNGILIYQPASNTKAVSIQGGANAVINGSIYAPGAAVTLGNGSATNLTAEIVAQTLTLNGGGTLSAAPSANLGTLSLSGARLSQ